MQLIIMLEYVDDRDVLIDVYTIFLAFIDFMREKYGEKHYKERINEFARHNNVELSGTIPKMHWLENKSFILTPTAYIAGEIIHSENLIKDKRAEVNSVRSKSSKRATYRNFNWDNLYTSCKLFKEFAYGESLNHEDFLFIARNMCGADKGKKVFLDIMDKRTSNKNWREMLNGIIKGNVPIQGCEICKYSNVCCHCSNMLETANPKLNEIKVTKLPEYVNILEAEKDLKDKFSQAVKSDEKGIHIIKAQTGLGKTKTYIDYLKSADMPCVIAVPTHELKEEIYQRAVRNGIINISCTPAFPMDMVSKKIADEVDHLYKIGAGKEVMMHLTMILSELNKSEKDYQIIKEFLEESKRTTEFKGHIITTHAKLITVSENSFTNHQIIIDEDILRQIYNTSFVSISDIRKVINNKNIPYNLTNELRKFLHEKGYRACDDKIEIGHISDLSNIDVNIYGLLNAEITYADDKNVLFIDRKRLSYDKVIIMSATAEHKLYEMLFKDRKIFRYECKKTRYIGKVIQHTDSSYSRFNLKNDIEKINKLIYVTKGKPVITFQSIECKFDTKYHFGNVEGLNLLEGKDLFVIGLPNLPEEVYKLFGMCAGADIKGKMRPQRIEYNCCSFRVNTFDNPALRMIQIWLLSSQLEQAVGRARLLRNDCKVEVYSGFPVEQAEYINKF